ncbi:MAG: cytochrome c oxidase subunit II [Planctomycetota bacterium]
MARSKPSRTAIGLAVFYALLLLGIVCGFALFGWRPTLASEVGAGVDRVITYLLVVTGAIVVVGHVVLARFVLRGDAEGGPEYRRPSRRAEWLGALIPVVAMSVLSEVGVLVMGTPVWAALYIEEPEDPFVLQVVGKQFEWIAHYPGKDGRWGRTDPRQVHDRRNPIGLDDSDPAGQDDIVLRQELALPVGRDVVIRLRTQDMLHSFFVPSFRVKQDLIPGFPTRVQFRATRTSTYELACAELCGMSHYTMRAVLSVLEAGEFERWLAGQETWFGG